MSGIVWLFLALAIVAEVTGTMSLRMAVRSNKAWYVSVVLSYLFAFTMLALTINGGMALGVAYGIWTAIGVALTAILGRLLFKEPFTWLMALGIALVMFGVILIETGAVHCFPPALAPGPLPELAWPGYGLRRARRAGLLSRAARSPGRGAGGAGATHPTSTASSSRPPDHSSSSRLIASPHDRT